MKKLVEGVLAALPEDLRELDRAALTEALTLCMAEGRAQWPELEVQDAQLIEVLVASLPDHGDLLAHLGSTPARDLWIGAACSSGESAAQEAFERVYFSAMAPAFARMKLPPHGRDEVRQTVREKLFLRSDSGPLPLHHYLGRGDLRAFLRVVTTRAALDWLRKQRNAPAPIDSDKSPELAGGQSPELALLKAAHADDFKRAFEDAIGGMEPRDRTLLRLSFVDQLSIDEIGALYGVHRSTSARQLACARAELAERTRDLLGSRLRLGEGEFTSVVRLIQSQLDLSITRVLQEPED